MSITDYHDQFAALYDSMYSDRDFFADARYAADLLELSNRRSSNSHVLDFGCGCGSHVLAFARLGIDATGFDKSTAMVSHALAKPIPSAAGQVKFVAGPFSDFCDMLNGQRFDGVVSIFQVFNCMESAAEMLSHLKLIRSRLAPGARFLVDVWNGAAVFVEDPKPDVRHYSLPDDPSKEIIRITTPKVDRINQRCTLNYRILTIGRGVGGSVDEFRSVHKITFLTPVQYRQLFELAGLELIDEFRRGSPGTPISLSDWYISYLVFAGD